MIIKRFSNPSAVSALVEPRVRHVVTCIHVPPARMQYEAVLPIGLQLPVNAYNNGGLNFSALQGEVESTESAINALEREAMEEYGLSPSDIGHRRYLVSTKIAVCQDYKKSKYWDYQWLHWFAMSTRRNFKPNAVHVAKFDWFAGPTAVFDAMSTAREEKLCAMSAAIAFAINKDELPPEYKEFATLFKYPMDTKYAAA